MLQGTASGYTRKEVVANAEQIASAYYGVKCVRVELSNEEADTERQHTGDSVIQQVTVFTADFTAEEWHRIKVTPYGPNECRDCRAESWPQNPLPGDGKPR